MRALTDALQSSDVAALRKLTKLMQKHPNVITFGINRVVSIYDNDAVQRHGAARGVRLDAPLLVVAIERCKAAKDPQGVMNVLVSE